MPEKSISYQGHEWNIDVSTQSLRYTRQETTADTITTLLYYPQTDYMEQRDNRGEFERLINLTTEQGFISQINNSTISIHLLSKPDFLNAYVHIKATEGSSTITHSYHNGRLNDVVIKISDITTELSEELLQQSQEEDPVKLLKKLAGLYESGSKTFFENSDFQFGGENEDGLFPASAPRSDPEDEKFLKEEAVNHDEFTRKYTDKIRTYLSQIPNDLPYSTLDALTRELLQRIWMHPIAFEDTSQIDNPEVFESLIAEVMSNVINIHYENLASEGEFYIVLRYPTTKDSGEVNIKVEENGNVQRYSAKLSDQIKFSYAGEYRFLFGKKDEICIVHIDTIHGPIEVAVPESLQLEGLNNKMRSDDWASVLEMVQVASG